LWVLNLKLFLFLSLFCLYQSVFSFSAITWVCIFLVFFFILKL
jgi:hypothetical protein